MSFEIEFDQKQYQKEINQIKNETARNTFFTDIFDFVADQIDNEAQKGIAKVTKELSQSFKKEKSGKELEIGYDTAYAAYNETGQRRDGSHKIQNRTPPGKDKWFETPLRQPKKIFKAIEDKFFSKLN